MAKKTILIGVAILGSALSWLVTHSWLASENRFSNTNAIVIFTLALSLSVALISIAWMFLDKWYERGIVIVGSWIAFTILWPSALSLLVIVVIGLLWWSAAQEVQNDLANRRQIQIRTVLGSPIRLILMAMFLSVSLGFYLSPDTQTAGLQTVSMGIKGQIEHVFQSSFIDDRISTLPPSLQKQFRADVITAIDSTVKQYLGPVAHYIPSVLALGFFVVLWGFGWIFRQLALWMATAIFAILKRIGFIKIVTHKIDAEKVEI